jgi:hypothetical protein
MAQLFNLSNNITKTKINHENTSQTNFNLQYFCLYCNDFLEQPSIYFLGNYSDFVLNYLDQVQARFLLQYDALLHVFNLFIYRTKLHKPTIIFFVCPPNH